MRISAAFFSYIYELCLLTAESVGVGAVEAFRWAAEVVEMAVAASGETLEREVRLADAAVETLASRTEEEQQAEAVVAVVAAGGCSRTRRR